MSTRSLESPEARKMLGMRIAAARHDLRWSQERFAESLGLDSITVSRIETGRRQVTLVLAMQIAEKLAISMERLLGTAGPAPDLVTEVATLLDRMPPERRATALDVLRVLAREDGAPADVPEPPLAGDPAAESLDPGAPLPEGDDPAR